MRDQIDAFLSTEQSETTRCFVHVAAALVILFALLRLGLEIFQIFAYTDPECLNTLKDTHSKYLEETKRKSGFRRYLHMLSCYYGYLRYFHDWENWIKLVMILFAIIFASVFTTNCLCAHRWQWQIGTLAVFLAWSDFILFIQKIPTFGIYVVMLVDIFVTFIKAVPTILMIVLGFTFGFFMLFYEPGTLVSFPLIQSFMQQKPENCCYFYCINFNGAF